MICFMTGTQTNSTAAAAIGKATRWRSSRYTAFYKQQYPDMLKRWTVEAILAKDEEVDASSTPLKTRPS